MRANSTDPFEQFSLVNGGPFNFIMGRFGLLAPDGLPTWRSATALALLAWLPPACLAIAQSLFDDSYNGWGFFTDPTVYTRFLIAVFILIATERLADQRLLHLVRQFWKAELIAPEEFQSYRDLLKRAEARANSWVVEVCLFLFVIAWSAFSTRYGVQLAGLSWAGKSSGDDIVLSWAGRISLFWCSPLFLFLVLRWFWRFIVWAELLFGISRLNLRLTPMHADRSAGLGFLAIYPYIFNGLVFALGCVISASILRELNLEQHSAQTVWLAMAAWLVFALIFSLGPLLVFVRPLTLARESALLEYGRLASQHHLAFHQKWMEKNRSGADLLGSPDPSSVSDLNASVVTAFEIRVFPVDGPAVIALLLSSALPLIAVVLREVPVDELVRWLVGAVF